MKNMMLNAYTAEDIRRKQNTGRRYVIEKVFEEIGRRIEEAASNNFNGVQVSFNDKAFEKFNIDDNVMRSVRNRFETLNFSVHISKFRKYILIQW
jgi:hypothetical protein